MTLRDLFLMIVQPLGLFKPVGVKGGNLSLRKELMVVNKMYSIPPQGPPSIGVKLLANGNLDVHTMEMPEELKEGRTIIKEEGERISIPVE